jgi:hypothetical protein
MVPACFKVPMFLCLKVLKAASSSCAPRKINEPQRQGLRCWAPAALPLSPPPPPPPAPRHRTTDRPTDRPTDQPTNRPTDRPTDSQPASKPARTGSCPEGVRAREGNPRSQQRPRTSSAAPSSGASSSPSPPSSSSLSYAARASSMTGKNSSTSAASTGDEPPLARMSATASFTNGCWRHRQSHAHTRTHGHTPQATHTLVVAWGHVEARVHHTTRSARTLAAPTPTFLHRAPETRQGAGGGSTRGRGGGGIRA